jgi:hypothetical protein
LTRKLIGEFSEKGNAFPTRDRRETSMEKEEEKKTDREKLILTHQRTARMPPRDTNEIPCTEEELRILTRRSAGNLCSFLQQFANGN